MLRRAVARLSTNRSAPAMPTFDQTNQTIQPQGRRQDSIDRHSRAIPPAPTSSIKCFPRYPSSKSDAGGRRAHCCRLHLAAMLINSPTCWKRDAAQSSMESAMLAAEEESHNTFEGRGIHHPE